MDEHLLQTQLQQYADGGRYPLHMPGHKRRMSPAPGLPFDWDVTEVLGTDDLHEARGILAQAMARTAAQFGAQKTWYLVGGSTVGLLAGIRALAPAGSSVIVARNCHKAVYHAIELGGLHPHWLTPPQDTAFGVYGSVPPLAVAAALNACPDARCVVLTSPTYEGVLSDIRAIVALCHSRTKPVAVLVDEAHGAHLGLTKAGGFPSGAVAAGADLVVQSAHKTLPSLTQTALLHVCGPLADPDEVERQLDVFETSSPSYPLLASLDGCTGILRARGEELFSAWGVRLARFDAAVRPLRRLRVLCHGGDIVGAHPEVFAFDPGKLLVSGRGAGVSGAWLADALRTRFALETEMACGQNLLAMSSLCDDEDALDRLADALGALEHSLPEGPEGCAAPVLPPPGEAVVDLAEALRRPACELGEGQAVGQVAAEYIWAYPPGVPLLAPGERITDEFLAAVRHLQADGTHLHHTGAKNGGYRCLLG